jgi:DNA polymerase III subunit beta
VDVTLDRTALAAAVTSAARALPARPVVPVLAGLKLEAADGQLTVSGYDYDVSAQTIAPADKVTKPGTVIVSGRLLADICKAVRGTVRLEQKGPQLILTAGSARFTLNTLPDDEYPVLPQIPASTVGLPGKLLAEVVAQVAIATSRDDTLPVLTGIQFEIDRDAETVTLLATDRYRFAVRAVPIDVLGETTDSKLLVPAKGLVDAVKTLSADTTVAVGVPTDAQVLGISGEHHRGTLRLLEGELPKYKSLFPTEFEATATIETGLLKEAVKRTALVAERNTPVRLHFTADSVRLEAGSSDDAQAQETVPAELDGAPFHIAFNPGFLLEGLDAIGSETIRIGCNGAVKPALLHAAGASNDDGIDEQTLRYLLMPVRLTS